MSGGNGGAGLRVGIDIGGTFTDYMAYEPGSRRLVRTKSLNGGGELGEVFSRALSEDLEVDKDELELLMHGTTAVTNLILERDGAKVGLIATRGFADVLEIGWSFRDDAYDPQWTKFEPLVPRSLRLEVGERVGPHGEVEEELDEPGLRNELARLREAAVEAVAVCLLHSYANPVHERRVKEIVEAELPGVPCVASSDVDPRLGEYERVSTTVLSAYATPRLQGYVERIEEWVGEERDAYFMQSEGGVIPARGALANPTSMVLSGPAAGVLAACYVGEAMGQRNLISIDVGGTSADVCIIKDGEPGLREVLEIEPGVPLRSPCLDVVSVGAGGGSIAWIDQGGALRVGPTSAGAEPGPACYGRGGEAPTVTDANVVLGITDADGLLGGRLEGDPEAAERAVRGLGETLGMSSQDAALGIFRIVNATMAQAIRTLTEQRGIDPRDFALISFGGAGGQHSVEVAREMQIPRVIFPPHPSTFSALGLLTADVQTTRIHPVVDLLEQVPPEEAEARFAELAESGRGAFREVVGEGAAPEAARFADLRYAGQVHSIRTPIEVWDPARIGADFEDLHEVRYGTRLGDPIEVVNVGVTSRMPLEKPELSGKAAAGGGKEPYEVSRKVELLIEGREVPVVSRASIEVGVDLPTPCLVEEGDSVLYLPGGSKARADEHGNLICDLEPL
jgi:N-methylhydantoinase A